MKSDLFLSRIQEKAHWAVQSTKGIILIRINESSTEDCNWDILPCRFV